MPMEMDHVVLDLCGSDIRVGFGATAAKLTDRQMSGGNGNDPFSKFLYYAPDGSQSTELLCMMEDMYDKLPKNITVTLRFPSAFGTQITRGAEGGFNIGVNHDVAYHGLDQYFEEIKGGAKSVESKTTDSSVTLPSAAPANFEFKKSPNAFYGVGCKNRYSVEMTLTGDKDKLFAALAKMPKKSIEGIASHMPDTASGKKHAAMQLNQWLNDLANPEFNKPGIIAALKAMPSQSRA